MTPICCAVLDVVKCPRSRVLRLERVEAVFMNGRWRAWAAFPLVLLGLGVYWPTLAARFTSDDFYLLRAVRTGGPLGLWADSRGEWFRPIISLSLYADDLLWHGQPAGFHATNVWTHILCAALVAVVTMLLLGSAGADRGSNRRAALLSGGLFLVLPCHSEAVSWVSGRTDVLATAFALGSVVAFLMARERRGWGPVCLLLLFAALLSKESTIVLPAVFLVLEAGRRGIAALRSRRTTLLILASFGVTLLALGARRLVLGRWVGGYGAGVHLNLDPRVPVLNLVLLPVRTVFPYLPLGGLPSGLPFAAMQDGLHRALGAGRGPLLVVAVGALGLLTWLTLSVLRRPRAHSLAASIGTLGTLTACYGVLLIPVLQMRVSLVNTQGERFLYLPSAFLCMALATLLVRRIRSLPVLLGAAAALLSFYSFSLVRENRDWQAAGAIYSRVVEELGVMAPGRPVVLLNLPDHLNGAYLFRNGLDEACRMELADRAPSRITVAVFHTLLSPGDRVGVTCESRRCRIHLDARGATFLSRQASSLRLAEPEGARIDRVDPRTMRLSLVASGQTTAWFSAGNLHRLQ
jgi:protein O-mannosyl-transferase